MKRLKNIIALMIILVFAVACEKEIDNLDKLNGVTAPTDVTTTFDVSQDNSGLVTILPNAVGVTAYWITFGDTVPETATKYGLNEAITHKYSEGVFTVGVTAEGLTGLTTKIEQELTVSFKAPEDIVVTVTPDPTNPLIISVSATATYATVMDIYFGDVENEEPVLVLPDSVAMHTYEEAGDYVLTVEAKSAGAASTVYSETITISEASDPVMLPIGFESFTINYAFGNFGDATSTVIDNPDASGINTSARVGQLVKALNADTWAGSLLTLGSPIDFSSKKLFKMKVWSPKSGIIVKLKVENLDDDQINHEVDATNTVSDQWEELSFDFSGIDMNNDYQKVVVFFDFGNPGDDAIYYFDDIKLTSSAPSTGIAGIWKVAPEIESLGVGPNQGDISWWSIGEADLTARACFFDDTYVFGADGSFSNVLGAETWIEGWQNGGGDEGCGAPVAPHDGTVAATYIYDAGAGTLALNGTGAYLGIPKAFNGGELADPSEAPESITYITELSEDNSVMIVDINVGTAWWRYKLIKEGGGTEPTPLEGTWQVAPEAESLGVGPNPGDISWWSISEADLTTRACFFDDTYVFGANGSFSNVVGTETWIEGWQNGGGDEGCAAPVAPHDGSLAATYTYDAGEGTVTLNGTGAYLGIPKAYNGGELTAPSEAPESITYLIELSEGNSVMIVDINVGTAWWRYKLVKN